MIELPEVFVLAEQIQETLVGKRIRSVIANSQPHGFALYTEDPAAYGKLLIGKKITGVKADLGTGQIWDCNVEIGNFLNTHTRVRKIVTCSDMRAARGGKPCQS